MGVCNNIESGNNSEVEGEFKRITKLSGAALKLALSNEGSRHERAMAFLQNPTLPSVNGLKESEIEYLLNILSSLDLNNMIGGVVGVGEREGRVYSAMVTRRHYRFAHGIGRSGNLGEGQPKATGSTLLQQIVHRLTLQMLKVAGLKIPSDRWSCVVIPVATGMTLSLVLRSLAVDRPLGKYVIMPRIDQKSCLKAVLAAGLQIILIENKTSQFDDSIQTDLEAMEAVIMELKPENIVAVMSITSCFAPRSPDQITKIAKKCHEFDIPHIVNNAYGIQSKRATSLLNEVMSKSTGDGSGMRIDAFICSSDKNFLVPVGAAIVVAPNEVLNKVMDQWAGRASSSPLLDLFITFLSMGKDTYQKLLSTQSQNYSYLKDKLRSMSGVRVLETPQNDISIAIKIDNVSDLGSKLFLRGVSGARQVSKGNTLRIGNLSIDNFGMHHSAYPHESYLTVAATIGQERDEVDQFINKLEKLLSQQ